MSFTQAIATGFSKYATFTGRACRSEYWYWILFGFVASIIFSVLDAAIFPSDEWKPLESAFSILILLPDISVTARRLHDLDKSGWWQLILLVPLIGFIVLLVWTIKKGVEGDNRFGVDPLLEVTPAA